MQFANERAEVAQTAQEMLDSGLVVNTSGNVSVRVGEHVAITPSGCAYDSLRAEDIVVLDMAGEQFDGDLLASSETPLHLAVYGAYPEVRAIVHTHSVYATAVSTLTDYLPAIHYQIADLGGPVPVAPYRTFGTPELAAAVTEGIRGRCAVLMQNHGSVTVGDTARQALGRSLTLEWLARVFLIASQHGDPSLIDAEELKRVQAQQHKFRSEQQRRVVARDRSNQ